MANRDFVALSAPLPSFTPHPPASQLGMPDMLYLENPTNTFTQWTGDRINGVLYQRNIEVLWTAEELAAIGLYIPASADPIPAGKTATATAVQRVNGTVQYVYTLADAPPPPVPSSITPAQARIVLDRHGLLDQVNSAVAASDRDTQSWWAFAKDIDRDSPTLAAMATALNLTSAQVDGLFIEGSTYEG